MICLRQSDNIANVVSVFGDRPAVEENDVLLEHVAIGIECWLDVLKVCMCVCVLCRETECSGAKRVSTSTEGAGETEHSIDLCFHACMDLPWMVPMLYPC